MKALVTGAAGFIGGHVVRALSASGADVYALTRRPPPTAPEWPESVGVTWIECDLDDGARVREVVDATRPDVAFHLAWFVEPGRWMAESGPNLAALDAGERLVNLLVKAGCDRIVLAGSGVEDLDRVRWHERPPASAYAATKRALHAAAEQLAATGTDIVCAHLYGVYGPGEDERRVVPLVVNALLRGEPVDLTDGHQRRDYLYVEDVASALVAVAASDVAGTLDIASGEDRELKALLAGLATESGAGIDLLRFGARAYAPDELVSYVGDPARLRSLGWQPAFDLAAGCRATVAYWRERAAGGRLRAG